MAASISPGTCIRCKGRLWCGLPRCPVYDRARTLRRIKYKKNIEAPSPPFYLVSWKNYPRVAVGPHLSVNGNPVEKSMDIPMSEFIAGQSAQVRPFKVKDIRSAEEAALSIRPVMMNAELKTILRINDFDLGQVPAVAAKKITLEDTPKIPGKIFEIVDSCDLKAEYAVDFLDSKFGFDYAVRVLSTGNIGVKSERKMVPTRWAITAVDSIIAKKLFEKVRRYDEIPDFEIYETTHWDNQFVILMAPWGWAFEMMESWHRGSVWGGGIAQDHEYGRLKKDYAGNITGAYYSARMEVLKQLENRRRRAAVFVFRRIGPGYVFPVGVWHVRDSIREALAGRPEKFGDLETALARVGEKLGGLEAWKTRSRLLPLISKQQRLVDYIRA